MSMISRKISESVGSKLRAKRILILKNLIELVHKENGKVSILDIGGLKNYWKILPESVIEKYKVQITVLRLPCEDREEDEGAYRFLYMDACDLSEIQDDAFDIAHSNSVIEHVGDWERMKQFSSELRRVSKFHFVQAPNFWFPLEPHGMTLFIHWLPKPWRLLWVQQFKVGYWEKARNIDHAVQIIESARLPNKKMFRALFPHSDIVTERVLGFSKSFIASTSLKSSGIAK